MILHEPWLVAVEAAVLMAVLVEAIWGPLPIRWGRATLWIPAAVMVWAGSHVMGDLSKSLLWLGLADFALAIYWTCLWSFALIGLQEEGGGAAVPGAETSRPDAPPPYDWTGNPLAQENRRRKAAAIVEWCRSNGVEPDLDDISPKERRRIARQSGYSSVSEQTWQQVVEGFRTGRDEAWRRQHLQPGP